MYTQTSLYSARAERLYINLNECDRFLHAADQAEQVIRCFAYLLAYTGMRLSEARYLTNDAIQLEARVISVETLKKRRAGVIREVPIPAPLMQVLSTRAHVAGPYLIGSGQHPIPRVKAYRWIKRLMRDAQITGPKACPKGLRHAFGTRAIMSGVPLHLLQRWMGHASMETTAIYANVLGADELQIADRMWKRRQSDTA